MADEKLNVSPEENPQPSLFDAGPAGAPTPEAPTPEPPAPENAPEQTGGDAPAQDAPAGAPGAVNVSLSQAQELRKLDKDGKLNGDVIDGILSREKKEVDKKAFFFLSASAVYR